MNTRQGSLDWPLFAAILLMLGFGIVLVYSSSFALSQHKYGEADFYLARQSIRALLAVACFMICINVDYHRWGRLSGIAYLAMLESVEVPLITVKTIEPYFNGCPGRQLHSLRLCRVVACLQTVLDVTLASLSGQHAHCD